MKKLDGSLIKMGEPIPFDCSDAQGNLLLKKGVVVATQRQLDALLERGLYGEVDGPAVVAKPNAKPPTPFQLLDAFTNRLKQLFSTINAEPGPERDQVVKMFSERVMGLAGDIQKLCKYDTDALLGAMHLDKSARYTIIHPLYRGVLSELLGKRKQIPEEDRRRIIAAGLTCALSMLKLQDELLKQEQPLTPEQKAMLNQQPLDTCELLKSLGVTDEMWLSSVAHYHELLNGKGYPAGLSGAQISLGGRVLRVADTYTAMLTPRPYRKALLSKSAMREILLKKGAEVDDELAIHIVKELGIYPPGAFVKIRNGELAVVIKRTENPKSPRIKAVVGPRGMPYDKPIPRDSAFNEFEVLDIVERDTIVVIDLHKLWNYEA
jgi:HD-GYP domain-containing protein (c-di-GMP phosphodiesterase class II)